MMPYITTFLIYGIFAIWWLVIVKKLRHPKKKTPKIKKFKRIWI